mmetsp:Transcript_8037/g.14997  ORF Transcript_8037/g.14997 Transcript_8037/m.14997 type:complete len:113 (-) Transcript_8037:1605-1943(-)
MAKREAAATEHRGEASAASAGGRGGGSPELQHSPLSAVCAQSDGLHRTPAAPSAGKGVRRPISPKAKPPNSQLSIEDQLPLAQVLPSSGRPAPGREDVEPQRHQTFPVEDPC